MEGGRESARERENDRDWIDVRKRKKDGENECLF